MSEGRLQSVVMRGLALSGAGNVMLRLTDLATALLLLRWLSIYEFGVYRLGLAAYDFAAGLFLAGVENVVVADAARNIEKNPARARTLFSVYFIFMSAVGVMLWALFFFGGALLTNLLQEAGAYARVISFLFLLAPLETAYKLKFQIFLDFGWSSTFRVLRNIARLAAMAGFFLFFLFGTREALLTIVAAVLFPIVVAAVGYHRPRLVTLPRWREFTDAWRDLFFRHGKWALLDDLLNSWSQNIRPFVIRTFVGVEAVGIISLAQTLIAYTKAVLPIREVLTPVMSRMADHANLPDAVRRATKYATWGYTLVGIGAALGMPVLIWLLFPKYMVALPFFYILLLGIPFFGLRSIAPPIFFAKKAQHILFRVTVTRTVILTASSVILTYFFGLWGAATEMLLIGIFTNPAYAKGLSMIIPGLQLKASDLFRYDPSDRVMMRAARSGIWRRIAFWGRTS